MSKQLNDAYYAAAKQAKEEDDVFLIMYVDEFRTKLDKLRKKAERLGVEPPIVDELAEVSEPSKRHPGRRYRRLLVRITGTAPKLPGWRFIGAITHLPGSSEGVFRAAPGETIDERFRRRHVCDHCNTNRRRNDTYIVHKNDTGEDLQVGTSCVTEFIGGITPQQLAAYTSMPHELRYFSDDYDGPKPRPVYDQDIYLRYVAASIRVDGWVSRGKAYEDASLRATADAAFLAMMPRNEEEGKWAIPRTPTEADEELAAAALAWGKEAGGSEYLRNLRSVANAPYINEKTAGVSASMIVAYRKANPVPVAATSGFIGEPKERIELDVQVQKIITLPDRGYGSKKMHIMESDGNRLTWFASPSATPLEEGRAVRIKATVSKHEVYRGEKQTIVNRVKEVA